MDEVICKGFDYKKDLQEQRELFLDCFPETLGLGTETEEHYLWKFQSKPGDVKSTEYIATINDEMVGYYAAIPYNYKIGDIIKPVAMVCDVMTSSKHRGKGIFVKMGKYSTDGFAHEGYAFSTGYPIREAVIPGHKKAGWTIAFELPLWMKFRKTDALLKSRKLGWLKYFGNIGIFTYNFFTKKRNNKNYRIRIFNDIQEIEGYKAFETEFRDSVRNILVKDNDFMQWRYGAPNKSYWFICSYDKNDKLVGMISTRSVIKEGVPSLGVLDISVLPKDIKSLPNLYNALFDLAKKEQKEAIMFVMSRSDAKHYKVKANGFLKSPFTFKFIYKKYDDNISVDELNDERNWHLMFVDSDDL